MAETTVLKGFRLPPADWDRLELFRQELQRTTPFRVTNAAALKIAVSSASAALAAGTLQLTPQPPRDG